MKLKSIQIAGFKSFADPTTINFEAGLTGVVGPNGSGKSNIIEAVRWALGEQSVKSMRSNRMKDVIFSGSKNRHPLNRAEVSLLFDNSTHWLQSDFSEVKITRKYYRSGESIYLLNNRECLLREINQLLLDTGLGEGSLSIISQGNVDAILDENLNQRRAVIETAAGVYRYKKQKQESKNRLAETQANVDRITDIVNELQKQLGPLEKQQATAAIYLQQQHELRKLQYQQLQVATSAVEQQQRQLQAQTKMTEHQQNQLVADVKKLQLQKQTLSEQASDHQQHLDDLHQQQLAETKLVEEAQSQQRLRHQRRQFLSKQQAELQDAVATSKQQLEQVQAVRQQQQVQSQQQQQELEHLKGKVTAQQQQLQPQQIKHLEQKLADTQQAYIVIMQTLTKKENELQSLDKAAQQDAANHKAQTQKLALVKEKLQQAHSNYQDKVQAHSKLRQQLQTEETQLAELETQRDSWVHEQQRLEQQLLAKQQEFQQQRAQSQNLQSIVTGHKNLYRGTRSLLAHRTQLPGVLGIVTDFLKVPKQYVTAMETALGSALQQVIVADVAAAQAAIRFLNREHQGRATVLPKNALRVRLLAPTVARKLQKQPGFVGVASDLVDMPADLNQVKQHLLGNVIIATDLAQATSISKAIEHRYRVVSLNGDVVNAGGSITGGKNQQKTTGLLQQREQLQQLQQQTQTLQTAVRQAETDLTAFQTRQQQWQETREAKFQAAVKLRSEVEIAKAAVVQQQQLVQQQKRDYQAVKLLLQNQTTTDQATSQRAQLVLEINDLKEQQLKQQSLTKEQQQQLSTKRTALAEQQAQLNTTKQQLMLAQERFRQLEHDQQQRTQQQQAQQQQQHNLQRRLQDLTKELEQIRATPDPQIAKLQQVITDLGVQLKQGKATIEMLQAQEHDLEKTIDQQQQLLLQTGEQRQQQTQQLKETKQRLQALHEQQTELSQKMDELPTKQVDSTQLTTKIKQLKTRLTELEPVNLGAIQAFRETKKRMDFMQSQLDDLLVARQKLLSVMNKMDQTVKEKFKATFIAVAQEFSQVFREMFGGGEARLVLENPTEMLTTGIDIKVQPPGKRFRSLNLLSGGEKSLTALALLFAIIRVRAVPFVILDEAESALDPANVDRFARYMKQLKARTQFIVITHRKETMIYADQLYGVTMQDSGVSKLVAVDLKGSN
ncbi:Chromosome partition protein smc [Fructilactobacillus florum 8D]|uniref:Chromosome partition protein Smc n=1 Tax=Fructilactobacillus florum 8D TaxID=1221538 RepID=W9EG04_9LACO|nr:chromosome segregation protein SMC [Fructilactobacillus florum]ETO40206.1 Chromosome partition protein smc [Fructilactobacillus florum 8D]